VPTRSQVTHPGRGRQALETPVFDFVRLAKAVSPGRRGVPIATRPPSSRPQSRHPITANAQAAITPSSTRRAAFGVTLCRTDRKAPFALIVHSRQECRHPLQVRSWSVLVKRQPSFAATLRPMRRGRVGAQGHMPVPAQHGVRPGTAPQLRRGRNRVRTEPPKWAT
jgi:hypothetical protein